MMKIPMPTLRLQLQQQTTILWVLLLLSSLAGIAQSSAHFSTSAFPETWDSRRSLRGRNSEVVAWAHFHDAQPFEYRVCLLVLIGEDSLGNTQYWIEEQYSNKKPFKKWNTAVIHYGPTEGEMIGRYDLHLHKFDHRPTADDIYALLEDWMFSFEKGDRFELIEGGLDVALWKAIFGFVPDPTFGSKE